MAAAAEKTFGVVTTIQGPTECMKILAGIFHKENAPIYVMGDKKGPATFDLEGCIFSSIADQAATGHSLEKLLPTGHYCRKNIGYLEAIANGAQRIFETDDDNNPLPQFIMSRTETVETTPLGAATDEPTWVNVYRLFSDDPLIWPRGLPLDRVRDAVRTRDDTAPSAMCCPIQQGLADGAPDVDAIWRLLVDRDFRFDQSQPSVVLPRNVWCPFNSQNTWWWPQAFELMYLPSFCSFRMTDIWRSFIAQRCLWELGCSVEFHTADVVQERNPHNLMRDFTDEVPGYTRNDALVKTLAGLTLESGIGHVGANVIKCYEALIAQEYFPAKELDLVKAWVADVATAKGKAASSS